MTAWSKMGAQARGGVGVGVAVLVAIAVYFGFGAAPESPALAPAPDVAAVPAAPETAAAVAEAPVAAAAPEAAVVAAVEPAALKIDLVRVAADGATTIAGMAAAGDEISFLMAEAALAVTTADASGNFVGLFDIAPAPEPRVMRVVAKTSEGVTREVELVIAPFAAPEALVATAEAPVTDAAEPLAAQAPAALLIAPEGVKVVQPSAAAAAEPAAVGGVTLDTITYGADGAVQLGGTGAAGSGLRVYLDQAVVAETAVGADASWQAVLTDVAAGVYTLRVDQLSADGKVTARFETPFKRETLEALAAVAAAAAPEPSSEVAALAEPAAVAPAAPASAEPASAATESAAIAPATPAPAPAAAVTEVQAPVAAAEQPAVAEAAPVAAAAPAAPTAETPVTTTPSVTITVQPGFTLWGIAKQEFGDGVMYVQVFNANKDRIKNPDLIYPGQVFTIPTLP